MSQILEHCQHMPVASFAPGELLLEEGASTGRLYVLIDGVVEVLKGAFQINVVDDAGAMFGDMSALLGIPHMASVRAVTACHAHLIENGAAFLQANKDVAYQLARLLAQRLHGVTGYLVDLRQQYHDREDHLGMVDEVLESLVHEQQHAFTPGSDREPDD